MKNEVDNPHFSFKFRKLLEKQSLFKTKKTPNKQNQNGSSLSATAL